MLATEATKKKPAAINTENIAFNGGAGEIGLGTFVNLSGHHSAALG